MKKNFAVYKFVYYGQCRTYFATMQCGLVDPRSQTTSWKKVTCKKCLRKRKKK